MIMNNDYKTISTKVTPDSHEMLERICAKRNVSIYNLLGMCIDTIIRYMDDRHNLSAEMQSVIRLFDESCLSERCLYIGDPGASMAATDAIYLVGSHNRSGSKAVLVESDAFGGRTEDWNATHIFDKVLNVCCPSLYKRLRLKALAMNLQSAFSVIDTILSQSDIEDDLATLRSEFEDCRRTDFGQKETDPVVKSRRNRQKLYVDSRFAKTLFD